VRKSRHAELLPGEVRLVVTIVEMMPVYMIYCFYIAFNASFGSCDIEDFLPAYCDELLPSQLRDFFESAFSETSLDR
jgi:hypothetical protein